VPTPVAPRPARPAPEARPVYTPLPPIAPVFDEDAVREMAREAIELLCGRCQAGSGPPWWTDYWWVCSTCGAQVPPYEEYGHDAALSRPGRGGA